MAEKRKGPIERIVNRLWRIFLNGLFAILPLTVTLGLFTITFRMIVDWLGPIRRLLETKYPGITDAIPYVEIFIIISIIFIIGTMLRSFLLRSLVNAAEELLIRIPIVRPVYSGIKQLVQAFGAQDKMSFKKVVVIEFPRPGIFSLGFLTSELPNAIAPQEGRKFFNVFVPTTPNPTSGYFVIVPEQDIIVIKLTRQEAMAMIISGGIIQPERFVRE